MNPKEILLKKFNDKEIVEKFTKFEFRKFQKEALKYIFDQNVLICAPTGSGKSLVAEIAAFYNALIKGKKVLYVVPLKALAKERYQKFLDYNTNLKISLSSSDYDENYEKLGKNDILIITSEKADSLIRHNPSWIKEISLLIADEIHLINDYERGPILEFVITYFKIKKAQILGLSATIGNKEELAEWLNAKLIFSSERPVKLNYGVLSDNKIYFR
ncbi:MAG: DEAD/DEAH box helicase [Candidatus Woesearchaeota archaeon]